MKWMIWYPLISLDCQLSRSTSFLGFPNNVFDFLSFSIVTAWVGHPLGSWSSLLVWPARNLGNNLRVSERPGLDLFLTKSIFGQFRMYQKNLAIMVGTIKMKATQMLSFLRVGKSVRLKCINKVCVTYSSQIS